jgi:hypothetical protein
MFISRIGVAGGEKPTQQGRQAARIDYLKVTYTATAFLQE